MNITSNAIKFTQEGSVSINVSLMERYKDNVFLLFTIKDTGIGMSREQLSMVFNAFAQVDSSVTRKHGGTGLGLAICKSLVELMGGEIWIESKLGEGTTFFFTVMLELAQSHSMPDATISYGELTIPDSMKGKRLLIVEDNEINLLIAQELLTQVGFVVDKANNGQEAINIVEENHYDLVLMDIQMPVMDGYTAAITIREKRKFDHIPIIAMTANAMYGDREKSLAAGMNDHITKPFVPKQMYEVICHWLDM
jgi:two-component system sensor histidine kinase/response regulator